MKVLSLLRLFCFEKINKRVNERKIDNFAESCIKTSPLPVSKGKCGKNPDIILKTVNSDISRIAVSTAEWKNAGNILS